MATRFDDKYVAIHEAIENRDIGELADLALTGWGRIERALALFNKPGATIDNVRVVLEAEDDA